MKLLDIPALRLQNLQITHSKLKTPQDLVSYLDVVQSQDFFGAHLPSALLLPNYDEYISSYADYSLISTEQTRKNLDRIGNAVFWNHMVWGGNIIGSWRRVFKPKVIEIQLAPLVDLTNEDSAAFEKAAQSFGDFFQLPVSLR